MCTLENSSNPVEIQWCTRRRRRPCERRLQLCPGEVCLGGEHMDAFRVGNSKRASLGREGYVSECDVCSGVANYLNRHPEIRALSGSVVVFSRYF